MAADVQTLFAEGKCFACFGPITQVQILRLVLLSRLATALNPVLATTPQDLLDQGECLACYGMSLADIMELVLLGLIANNIDGGGGGGSSNLSGVVDPIGVVVPTALNQLYTNMASVPKSVWQSTGLTSADWVQLV